MTDEPETADPLQRLKFVRTTSKPPGVEVAAREVHRCTPRGPRPDKPGMPAQAQGAGSDTSERRAQGAGAASPASQLTEGRCHHGGTGRRPGIGPQAVTRRRSRGPDGQSIKMILHRPAGRKRRGARCVVAGGGRSHGLLQKRGDVAAPPARALSRKRLQTQDRGGPAPHRRAMPQGQVGACAALLPWWRAQEPTRQRAGRACR